jgi:hypothetical protein
MSFSENIYNRFNFYIYLIIFGLSYVSLFYSFHINEDGTGHGASGDFEATYGFILALKNNLLSNPKDFTLVHTPLHFMIMSLFDDLFSSTEKLRLFYCSLTILLPIFFYLSMKKKEFKENKKNLLLLSSIIFILPSFRYAAIWATDLITSLIFFQISIFFFWKWNAKKSKNINKYLFFQILFLAFATYCRQYFAVFFIYFLFIYYQNLNQRSFIKLFMICVLTSIPVLYYTYLFPALIVEQHISFYSIKYFLLGNSSMMSIYLIPIFFINIIYKKIKFDQNILISVIASFTIVLILSLLFVPVPFWLGGGVVHKLSNQLFGNNYLFLLSSFFTFLIFIYLILENKINLILIIILLFMFFSFQTYQRYYEPMLYLIIFSLIRTKMLNVFFEKSIACIILFLYFLFFYFGSVTDIVYKI